MIDPLKPLTEEELKHFKPITEAEIKAALEEGRRDAEKARVAMHCRGIDPRRRFKEAN